MTTTTPNHIQPNPLITHPAITGPDSGLVRVRGLWYACYTSDGRPRRKSMGTTDQRQACARRDAFYAALDAAGATVPARGRPKEKLTTGDFHHIYHRPAWVVRHGRKVIGHYHTAEEACAARDAHFGVKTAEGVSFVGEGGEP